MVISVYKHYMTLTDIFKHYVMIMRIRLDPEIIYGIRVSDQGHPGAGKSTLEIGRYLTRLMVKLYHCDNV